MHHMQKPSSGSTHATGAGDRAESPRKQRHQRSELERRCLRAGAATGVLRRLLCCAKKKKKVKNDSVVEATAPRMYVRTYREWDCGCWWDPPQHTTCYPGVRLGQQGLPKGRSACHPTRIDEAMNPLISAHCSSSQSGDRGLVTRSAQDTVYFDSSSGSVMRPYEVSYSP
jgi:hypothetical protein